MTDGMRSALGQLLTGVGILLLGGILLLLLGDYPQMQEMAGGGALLIGGIVFFVGLAKIVSELNASSRTN